MCALWPWPLRYDLGSRSWHTLGSWTIIVWIIIHIQQGSENYGPDTDFGYVCIVTLTLDTLEICQGHDTSLSHGQQLALITYNVHSCFANTSLVPYDVIFVQFLWWQSSASWNCIEFHRVKVMLLFLSKLLFQLHILIPHFLNCFVWGYSLAFEVRWIGHLTSKSTIFQS